MDKRLSSFLSTVASVFMGLVIWALILAISNKNPVPLDITRGGRYTLSAQSIQAVQKLPSPVKVYAFCDDKSKPKAEELLKRYKKIDSKNFSFEVLDPRKHPLLAKKYGIRFVGEGVVELQDKDTKGRTERLGTVAEQDVTTALLKLQRQKTYKAYFLTGHGERSLDQPDEQGLSQLKADLVKEGFQVEPLALISTLKIPADADMVVAAGPIKPLLPAEEKALQEYLANYGRFFLLVEPETPEVYGKLVKDYGAEVTDDIVLDQNAAQLHAEPVFSVGITFDPGHPITKDYKMQVMFQLARPVKVTSPLPAGVTAVSLVSTSARPQTAMLIKLKEVLEGGAKAIDPSKLKLTTASLAVASSKKEAAAATPTPTPAADQPKQVKETRVVTVGDSDAMCNSMYLLDKDFILNSFNWLAANETQISIRPKDPEATPLNLSGGEQTHMLILLVLILPGALVAIGAFMVMRRQ